MTRLNSARTWLAGLWLVSFAIAASMPLYLMASHRAEWDTIRPALEELSAIYAPYLGVILAFYFGSYTHAPRRERAATIAGILAIALSLLWNVFVVGATVLVVVGSSPIEDATRSISEIGPKLSWLVAPAIGYFFAQSKPAKDS